MRVLRMIWAALLGWMVDYLLTSIFVGLAFAIIGLQSTDELNFAQPMHILVGLGLPVLMTMIGGGVAGATAPLDPTPAGALVGGIGLLMMSTGGIDMESRHALAFIIAQCVAVVGAAITATLVAHRQQRRI